MNTFMGLFFYMVIGGAFAVMANNDFMEECNRNMSDSTVTYITIAWPAVIPIGLLTDESTVTSNFECPAK